MKKIHYTTFLYALGLCLVGATHASAESTKASMANTARDDAYVTVSGTVAAITDDDEFELNYGQGRIKVDTNDAWPNMFQTEANNTGRYLKAGDRVVVNGRIDDNWFARKEIDAESLRFSHGGEIIAYNRTDNSEYNLTDEDNAYLQREGYVRVSGVVSKVEDEDSYTIRTGTQGTLMVDASDIDDDRHPALKAGDRVIVTGELDETLFNKREIEADTVQRVSGTQQSRL